MAVIFFSQADRKFGYTSSSPKQDVCILSDGTAYYAYLPQYLVYGGKEQYQFAHEIDLKFPGKNLFSMLKFDPETGKLSNKFYIGTALAQSPFYFVAHKLHQWNEWDADGYQLGYRFSIQLAAIFYWLIGVYALFKLFRRLQFSRSSILVGIILVSLGTNLNYYISYLPSMSHAYSFGMVACFLNVAHCWVHKNEQKYLVLAFFLLGLITVIRPVNFLVVLIVPFMFESFHLFWLRLKELVLKKWFFMLLSILLFILPVFLNVLVIYDQFGEFGLYTYQDEGFSNVLHPEFFNVLFSYQKGFFIYAPVMFCLFIALFFFIKHAKKYFLIGWSLCVVIWLYAISSWWCWDYGGGLGMRAMIELLPLFIFPFLYMFKYGGKIINGLSGVIFILGIALYQVFQIQYNNYIIHCCEMNKERFWDVFLKTNDRFRWKLDFDAMREKLDDSDLKTEFNLRKNKLQWDIENVLEPKTWFSFDEASPILHMDSATTDFKAIIQGEILLNSPEINPFVKLEYFSNDVFVEESIFTIGSNVLDPYHFEKFKITVNHNLVEKNLNKVKIQFLDGGGNPIYKHLLITKFK